MPIFVDWDGEDVDLEDIPEDQHPPRRRRREAETFNEGTGLKGSGGRRRNVQPYRQKTIGRRTKENGGSQWQ